MRKHGPTDMVGHVYIVLHPLVTDDRADESLLFPLTLYSSHLVINKELKLRRKQQQKNDHPATTTKVLEVNDVSFYMWSFCILFMIIIEAPLKACWCTFFSLKYIVLCACLRGDLE